MPIEILMPALSPTMEEGTLAKWHVKVGDTVNSGDLLAEIETDKATMEVEAVEEGTVGKLMVAEGAEGVKVNAPIAVLLEEGETEADMGKAKAAPAKAEKEMAEATVAPADADNSVPGPRSGDSQDDTAKPTETPAQGRGPDSPPPSKSDGKRIFASPLAKRLAAQANISLELLTGTGPNGRIVKRDVDAAKENGVPAQEAQATPTSESRELGPVRSGGAADLAKMGVAEGTYTLEPLDGMRKVIAKRLVSSNVNVPDFPLMVDVELDALLSMRKQLNGQVPEGIKISVNDMIVRASALALKHLPAANASYTPDGIAYHKTADVAVAVAIDGGLITPIVREADNKGLSTISVEIKDLATRAKTRKLKPQEYQGGTFSVSNLGMFGIKAFGSIINEPHGMILSVGAGEPRPVVRDGEIVVRTVMTVTLTCDHRVVDGALGAQWLKLFKDYVQNPITMML